MIHRLTVACVGRLKEPWLRDACAEYAKRIGGFCRLTVTEVEEDRLPEHPSAAQITGALEAEGRRLLQKTPGSPLRVALCVEGKMLSSPELAVYLDTQAVRGKSDAVMYIGGSWGLSDSVKAAADLRLSLSLMTFPHQLARVMLLEQIYRALQISSGGKYHK